MRTYRRFKRWTTRAFLLLVVLMVAQACMTSEDTTTLPNNTTRTITKVVDGDTITLDGGEKIRLIGVDTPEVYGGKQCFGPESSAYTKSLLKPGTQVRVELDKDHLDSYSRTLAYIYRVDDGLFVNADLIANGYAREIYYAPNGAHRSEFQTLQSQAQLKKLGRWAACP